MTGLSPDLRQTLAGVAAALAPAHDPWWIIAGAAAALYGVSEPPPADVDVLLSERDAIVLLARLGIAPLADGGDGRFHSAVYARWSAPPLPVELMAGLQVLGRTGWERVAIAAREAVVSDGVTLWVPARAELATVLRRFGRPKDLARATALERLTGNMAKI